MDFKKLNTSREIAQRLRLSIAWLDREAWKGTGPPFIKIGNSRRYLESDFQVWLNHQPRGGCIEKED